ncbi:MAG: endonuclease III [Planctomycetota bacterium]|nr:endonuclease III [Planctomycetota bacterium]
MSSDALPVKDKEAVVRILSKRYQKSLVERVGRGSPYRILVATILSQRTRDETTERVAESFFRRFKSVWELDAANVGEIRNLIKSVGFSSQKAHNLKQTARILVEKYEGKVPDEEEKLKELPGVGQKTAGCILVYAFGKPALPVDTHVHRISNRLGWVKTKRPEETEKELKKVLKKDLWLPLNRIFVLFGREVCQPREPKCVLCPIKRFCKQKQKS